MSRGQLDDVVCLHSGRLRGTAVATLIGCQHAVAGLGQGGNLVPPGVGQFREAVGQDHDWGIRVTGVDDPKLDPVRLD